MLADAGRNGVAEPIIGRLETRHVRNAFKIMPVKTDRKDARGIAKLMRLGWFRPVHCKSMEARETRPRLTARKLVQKKPFETQSSLRGILRGFGLKIGKTTPVWFEGRVRGLLSACLPNCLLNAQFAELPHPERPAAAEVGLLRLRQLSPKLSTAS